MARPYGSNGGAAISCRRTRSSRRSQARSGRARLPYGASLPVMRSPTGSSFHRSHVAESFRRDGSAYAKLFYNPYGVDLAMFPPRREKATAEPFSLLFVGTWCLRKGCDLLIEAIKRVPGARLTHVGAIGDLDFPANDDRFVHVDPVPQRELARFYAAGDVFVLASREEGFGMVLSQALASGLPLICTDRTGGADLAHTAGARRADHGCPRRRCRRARARDRCVARSTARRRQICRRFRQPTARH